MRWVFTCQCGEEVAGATERELVAAAERHVAQHHPAVGTRPDAADVLAMALREETFDEPTSHGP